MRSPVVAKATATLAAVAILVVGVPLVASAHVGISPNTATAGSDIQVTFRVPNELEDAGTVAVEIDLPTATPFADGAYEPVAGWTAHIVTAALAKPVVNDGVKVTEAPVKIIYVADAGVSIGAGQFQEFPVALDLTPSTGRVQFSVIQTYSNGTVVAWNQHTPKSGDEPEHPAPTLYINDAPPTRNRSGIGLAVSPELDSVGSTASTALILGTAGLALGVIALVLGAFAFARTRRR